MAPSVLVRIPSGAPYCFEKQRFFSFLFVFHEEWWCLFLTVWIMLVFSKLVPPRDTHSHLVSFSCLFTSYWNSGLHKCDVLLAFQWPSLHLFQQGLNINTKPLLFYSVFSLFTSQIRMKTDWMSETLSVSFFIEHYIGCVQYVPFKLMMSVTKKQIYKTLNYEWQFSKCSTQTTTAWKVEQLSTQGMSCLTEPAIHVLYSHTVKTYIHNIWRSRKWRKTHLKTSLLSWLLLYTDLHQREGIILVFPVCKWGFQERMWL